VTSPHLGEAPHRPLAVMRMMLARRLQSLQALTRPSRSNLRDHAQNVGPSTPTRRADGASALPSRVIPRNNASISPGSGRCDAGVRRGICAKGASPAEAAREPQLQVRFRTDTVVSLVFISSSSVSR